MKKRNGNSVVTLTLTLSPRRGNGLPLPPVVVMRVGQIQSPEFRECCGRFSLSWRRGPG